MFQQIICKNPTYPMIMMIMLAGLKSTQRGIRIKKNFNIDHLRQNYLKCRLLNVAGHQDTQLFSKHEGLCACRDKPKRWTNAGNGQTLSRYTVSTGW